MKENEERYQSIISDKNRLNDVLSKTAEEKGRELEKLAAYPDLLAKKDEAIRGLEKQVRKLTEQAKEAEYAHKMALLEKDRQVDQAKTEVRKEMEDLAAKQREKYEAEIAKVREKYEQAQIKIQELMAKS